MMPAEGTVYLSGGFTQGQVPDKTGFPKSLREGDQRFLRSSWTGSPVTVHSDLTGKLATYTDSLGYLLCQTRFLLHPTSASAKFLTIQGPPSRSLFFCFTFREVSCAIWRTEQ